MIVKIGKYLNFWGPYQIAEKILFWIPKYDEKYHLNDTVHNFGKWLSEDRHGNDSYLSRFCQWVQDHRKRTVKIKVHSYDAWNADNTMALIIHPVLVELRRQKHGSGFIEDADVPEHLRSSAARPLTQEEKDCGHTDDLFHKRYEWVLDEMIWAFAQIVDPDDEDQFWTRPAPDAIIDKKNIFVSIGTCDYEALKKHHDRISNGTRLFGVYFQSLWS